jgi:ABC-type transport system involved in multi-copper enzyme maturation permease subunit
MTFLPIVGRELLEASRRRATYWMRLASAAAGLVIGGWVMLMMRREPPAVLGMALFVAISVAAYIYCLFTGVFRAADCLSEEKREGTLGLLFLTDLSGYDIVFGKLAATSLNAFYGILALFPVMAIPLLVGGVTIAEFWRVVLVSMNTLFFSLAVGMFCSSISRDERRAMVVAFIIVLFFAAGFPLLAAFCYEWRPARFLFEYALVPSPGYAAFMAFDYTFNKSSFNHFYPSVLFTHVSSWVLLVAASLIVPRTWQDKALTAEQVKRREQLNRLQLGSSEKRRNFRQRLLALNPFYWLAARHVTKPVAVWALLALVGFIWMLGLTFNPHDWKDDTAYVWTAVIVQTVLKFWVVTEACRRFSLDRQSGALELLLSTPIQVKEIVRGQWMALERQFAGPVFAVLVADFVFLLAGRRESEMVLMWVVGMVVFVTDLLTLSWLGMWRGLNSRRPNRAAAAALVRVLVLPWMVYLLFLTFIGLSSGFGGRSSQWTGHALIIFWGIISLVFSAVFGLPARRRLLEEFRQVATQRFETRGEGK